MDTIQGSASLWLFHYRLTLASRFVCVCRLSLSLFLSHFSSRAPFPSFPLLQKLIRLVPRTPFGPGHALHLLVLLSFIIRYLMDCSPTPTCSREPGAGWPQSLPLPSVLQKTLWHVFWASILATSLQGLQTSACRPFLRVLLWALRQHILPATRMMTAFHILCPPGRMRIFWMLCVYW